MIFSLLAPAVAAAFLAYTLAPLVARLAVRLGAVDQPGARKIHTHPVPRLGGLSVLGAVGVTWVVQGLLSGQRSLPADLAMGLGIGLIPVVAVSIADDIRSVRPGVKLLGHLMGAVVAVSFGVSLGAEVHLFGANISLGWLAIPLSVLWFVGLTNAFNLIDGLDGLSTGIALIASSSLAAVFALSGQPVMAGSALVLTSALAGFLPYNLHPARLFLGDTGAAAIGFVLAALALRGGSTLSSGFAVLIPVFILGLPITDTVVTIARRGLRRLEHHRGGLFVADQNHIHHRLLALGVDHKRAVLLLYGAGLLCAGAAFVSMLLSAREAALFTAGLMLAGLIGIHRLGYREFAFIRRGIFLKLFEVSVVNRSMFAVFVDLVWVVVAAYVAVGVTTGSWSETGPVVLNVASVFAPLTVLVFWLGGLYRGSWRLAGVNDFVRLCGTAVSLVLIVLLGDEVFELNTHPSALFLVYGLVSLVLVTASRAGYIVLVSLQQHARVRGTPVLVYGAGGRGVAAVQELYRDGHVGLRPIGFVDDDARKIGRLVSGLPVVESLSDLETTLRRRRAGAVLIATSKLRPDRLERVSAVCQKTGTSLFRARMLVERLSDEPRLDAVDSHPDPQLSGSAADVPVLESPPSATSDRGQSSSPHLPVASGPICPACGLSRVYRSRSRGQTEALRKRLTDLRPHRCPKCNWRGWVEVLDGFEEALPRLNAQGLPDLGTIDQLIATLSPPVFPRTEQPTVTRVAPPHRGTATL